MWAKLKSLLSVDAEHSPTPHQQQLAAAALLIELSKADYVADSAEQLAVIDAVRRISGLDDAELKNLLADARRSSVESTSLYEFTSQINSSFSEAEKFTLMLEMWRVAAADGEIHKYEDHLIRKVAELLYVPHSQFIRAKLQVLDKENA